MEIVFSFFSLSKINLTGVSILTNCVLPSTSCNSAFTVLPFLAFSEPFCVIEAPKELASPTKTEAIKVGSIFCCGMPSLLKSKYERLNIAVAHTNNISLTASDTNSNCSSRSGTASCNLNQTLFFGSFGSFMSFC